MTDNRICCQI